MQTSDTNARLYSELTSRREESESALRKDMFTSIINSFLREGPATPEQKMLNLELLVYNFHESLDLKPLFQHIQRNIRLLFGYDKRRGQPDRVRPAAQQQHAALER